MPWRWVLDGASRHEGPCLLHRKRTMKVLARFKSSVYGVLGDVRLKTAELQRTSHKVIEAFLLPKPPPPLEHTVDLSRRESFPRPALPFDFDRSQQARQHVHVVGHNDKARQMVALPVKM